MNYIYQKQIKSAFFGLILSMFIFSLYSLIPFGDIEFRELIQPGLTSLLLLFFLLPGGIRKTVTNNAMNRFYPADKDMITLIAFCLPLFILTFMLPLSLETLSIITQYGNVYPLLHQKVSVFTNAIIILIQIISLLHAMYCWIQIKKVTTQP